ncbi:hypothetical protein DERF_016011 [Dermatophagoides farinae]|uniref:Uncharacterized protein n=1 Tax=Dermatophagoides farinae TaxID=6954 RepID=A0A922HN62_DERFA|nr:hypothetical protein DERF_016011 [Dermatophagoides farinae]
MDGSIAVEPPPYRPPPEAAAAAAIIANKSVLNAFFNLISARLIVSSTTIITCKSSFKCSQFDWPRNFSSLSLLRNEPFPRTYNLQPQSTSNSCMVRPRGPIIRPTKLCSGY